MAISGGEEETKVFHTPNIGDIYQQLNGYMVPEFYSQFAVTGKTPGSFCLQIPQDFWGSDTMKIYQEQAYFSDRHAAYAEGYTLEARLQKYGDTFPKVTQLLRSGGKYADLGGGPGYYAFGVMNQLQMEQRILPEEVNSRIFVHDPSTIEDEQVMAAGINRTVGVLNALPYKTGDISMATCHHVLEHVHARAIGGSLNEIHRVLEHEGIFYGIIPTIDSLRVLGNKEVRDQILLDKTHITLATRRWWEEQFEDADGFIPRPDLVKKFDAKEYGWVFCYQVDK